VQKEYLKAKPTEFGLDDAAKKWITLLAKGSAGVIAPMCAIFGTRPSRHVAVCCVFAIKLFIVGGIIGQEIIKAVSSKYTPIKQFFFNDALECLPSDDLTVEDCAPKGTRYDGQVLT